MRLSFIFIFGDQIPINILEDKGYIQTKLIEKLKIGISISLFIRVAFLTEVNEW